MLLTLFILEGIRMVVLEQTLPCMTFRTTRCMPAGWPQCRVACLSMSGELLMACRSPRSTTSRIWTCQYNTEPHARHHGGAYTMRTQPGMMRQAQLTAKTCAAERLTHEPREPASLQAGSRPPVSQPSTIKSASGLSGLASVLSSL